MEKDKASPEKLGQCPGCKAFLTQGVQTVRASWGRLTLKCGNCSFEIPIAVLGNGRIVVATGKDRS